MTTHHDLPLGKINYCQVCGGTNIHDVIDLGTSHPATACSGQSTLIWRNKPTPCASRSAAIVP